MKEKAAILAFFLLTAASAGAAQDDAAEKPAKTEEPTEVAKTEKTSGGRRQVLESIVARVNNEVITQTELQHSEDLLRQELRQQGGGGATLEARFEEEKKNALRDLIDQSLLVQRGRDRGVTVEADVIKRLDQLRQQMNLSSMEELERAMAAQGISIEDYKENLREQLITQIVIQREVAGNVFVDAEKVRNYYLTHRDEFERPAQVRLREILVTTEGYKPSELPAREERVREILTKIRKGEKFEDLAKEYSDAPTAQDGGEMGYFDPDKLAPQIRDVVQKLNVGGVADPMLTRDGWLILKVEEHHEAGVATFDEAETEIRSRLYYDEVKPALRDFLGELRKEAFIFVQPGFTDTGAVEVEERPQRRVGSRRSSRRRRDVD